MSEGARPPLPAPGTAALILDVDATLIDVPAGGAAGLVRPERIHLLARLHDRLDGALALLSGRTVEALDELVAPLQLTLLGVHGVDRRLDDGSRQRPEALDALGPARATLVGFALERAGVRFEDKGAALALHGGGAVARTVAERALAAAQSELALRAQGDTVELLPAGHDEATALAALAGEPPFRGRRPVFVGGPDGREAGLRAAAARDGTAVVVGASEDAQAGEAWALEDVAALEAWLEDWLCR